KLVLLMAVAFALMSIAVPVKPHIVPELNFPWSVVWSVGTVIGFTFAPVIFHLHLLFPEPSSFVRRFPAIEWLLYLPWLFFLLPIAAAWQLSLNDYSFFDPSLDRPIFSQLLYATHTAYLLGAMAMVAVNYFSADSTGKRRIRFYTAGATVSVVPHLTDKLARPIEYAFNLRLIEDDGFRYLVVLAPAIFLPISLAYAITRHKVIPVSFVIRRGLQYLLAKNALRLLLLLPIVAILWNLASNPGSTLAEIILNNSLGFYFSLLLAAALFAFTRFGLAGWVDRKFFRRQYDKEQILHELGAEIQEVDSVSSLSRLVTSKIDEALHPLSIHLFFRDNDADADFSLGDPLTWANGADMKIDSDSPVLRVLASERRAIDLTQAVDGLPATEERWLRFLGASLLVPMHGTNGKLRGLLALGEKRSEIPYTSSDKTLLTLLATQISLIHENLKLKDRVITDARIRSEVLSRVDASSLNLLRECPKCGRCYDREAETCVDDRSELTFTMAVERTIENRYRLERLIGKGAMGAVYEATDKRINRRIAVKILSAASFGNREALRRFQREAQTAGRVRHPNVVTIFDYGVLSTEGAFLAMELVAGESLRQILDDRKTLADTTVVAWFAQVLDGIKAAHAAGIVHRDLKPANIVVSEFEGGDTRLSILDFGLAREQEVGESVTVPGTILGTFGYMAPEQLRGEQADERSDLFAIGVMIYEAVHGNRPFQGTTFHDLMRSMVEESVFYQNRRWAAFFTRALALDPERRYRTADKMKEALLING
ncbi:MAG TPA: protein kinase, partial [Pyrinomonadaceae bacterium]|nr:protein kinase [Pyrinomonadaceae bacterium]